jgi:hypothetical protein
MTDSGLERPCQRRSDPRLRHLEFQVVGLPSHLLDLVLAAGDGATVQIRIDHGDAGARPIGDAPHLIDVGGVGGARLLDDDAPESGLGRGAQGGCVIVRGRANVHDRIVRIDPCQIRERGGAADGPWVVSIVVFETMQRAPDSPFHGVDKTDDGPEWRSRGPVTANLLQDGNVQTQPRSSQADNHRSQALGGQGHIRHMEQAGRQQPGRGRQVSHFVAPFEGQAQSACSFSSGPAGAQAVFPSPVSHGGASAMVRERRSIHFRFRSAASAEASLTNRAWSGKILTTCVRRLLSFPGSGISRRGSGRT